MPIPSSLAATDLHLQPGSPCLGAGTAAGAPTTDITGATRPNPPSIGAYEQAPAVSALSHVLWDNAERRGGNLELPRR